MNILKTGFDNFFVIPMIRRISVIFLTLVYLLIAISLLRPDASVVLRGISAQLLLLVSIIMVLKFGRFGTITAICLNSISVLWVAYGFFFVKVPEALTGIIVSMVSLFIILLVTSLFKKQKIQFEQLRLQNEKMQGLFAELSDSQEKLKNQNLKLIKINKTIKANEKKLHKLAYYDELTGFANRSMLLEHLTRQIKISNPEGIDSKEIYFSLILIDIEGFKKVNESFGYEQGDNIIKFIAQNIKNAADHEDMIGRIIGAEFAIITRKGKDRLQLMEYVDKIKTSLISAINLSDNKIKLEVSIGTAIYPKNGQNSEELWKKATQSLKQKKGIHN